MLLLAALMAAGALQIKGDAGYAGAGPAFLPWVVAGAMATLGLCFVIGAWRSSTEWVGAPARIWKGRVFPAEVLRIKKFPWSPPRSQVSAGT